MTRIWMIASIGLCVLLPLAAGCVTLDEHNQVLARLRNSNVELEKCQTAVQQARADRQTAQDRLGLLESEAVAKDTRITALQSANGELGDDFKELYDKYQALVARRPQDFLLPGPVNAALKALANSNPELMEFLPKYGMLKLKADLTFGKGSAEVKGGAVNALKKLATIVNTEAAKGFHVYVAGHTDDIPLKNDATIRKHGTNWGLSAHRALAVVKELFQAGVEQKRMGAIGFSKYHPVADNKPGKQGNPLNRRVEIWIVPPNRLLTASSD